MMTVKFLSAHVIPFVALFLALLVAAIAADAGLHAADLADVGRWLGPIGSGMLVVSFGYSLRKRKWIRAGSPKRLLQFHETL